MLSLNPLSIVLILGVVQGLFLTSLLLSKKSNKTANRILALLILLYSLFIAHNFLDTINAFISFPYYKYFIGGLPFLFGPLHYLYARVLISPDKIFSKKQWLHFLPFMIDKVYYFPYLFKSKEVLIAFLQETSENNPTLISSIFTIVVTVQGLTYMRLTLQLLKRHSKNIEDNFSTIDRINLKWLKTITILTLLVWIILSIDITLMYAEISLFPKGVTIVAFSTSILIYAMGYLGLGQVEIFSPISNAQTSKKSPTVQEESNPISANAPPLSYSKSSLPPERATRYLQKLLDLMEEEKLFTDCDLTLQMLADRLSISTHNLSEVINTQMKQNFFDFINKYRVEEVKNAITDPDKSHFTLLSLAFDAGFNSKSSFNSVFKKHTKMTPSQFKQNSKKI